MANIGRICQNHVIDSFRILLSEVPLDTCKPCGRQTLSRFGKRLVQLYSRFTDMRSFGKV